MICGVKAETVFCSLCCMSAVGLLESVCMWSGRLVEWSIGVSSHLCPLLLY